MLCKKVSVGDTVRIRDDIRTEKRYGPYGLILSEDSIKHKGKIAKIRYIDEEDVSFRNQFFRLDVDTEYGLWCYDMLDHVCPNSVACVL